MLKIVSEEEEVKTEITLVNDKNRPTPLLAALVTLEVGLDLALAYTAYRVFRFLKK